MEKSAVRAMEKSLCYLRSIKGSGSPEDSLPSLDMSSNSGHGSVLEVDDFVSDGEVSMSFPADDFEHIIENNRRYCNRTYHMPNDEAEQTRLNIVHQIYLILLDGKLTTVPITSDAPRILDVGTGPGDWAIEMSGLIPEATIIASDIGLFDTGICHIDLPNVTFQLDDAREEWVYSEPFDLVHMRGLSGAFRDWNFVYEQAFKNLKPGGYIEVSDIDPAGNTINVRNSESSYLSIYGSAMRSASELSGYPRDLNHLRPAMLSAAGFVDVRVFESEVPIGLWPADLQGKTLGKMGLIALLEGLEAFSLRPLTAMSKWTVDEVQDICKKVQGELITAGKVTLRVRIVSARKPESTQATT